MHHIVCDGWSNGILIRDFTDFYAAFAEHSEPNLPELPFQFADFTVWQQNWLESDAATRPQSAIGAPISAARCQPSIYPPTDRVCRRKAIPATLSRPADARADSSPQGLLP
jgi:hypothetical protein